MSVETKTPATAMGTVRGFFVVGFRALRLLLLLRVGLGVTADASVRPAAPRERDRPWLPPRVAASRERGRAYELPRELRCRVAGRLFEKRRPPRR
jgi:hypothetical protein